MEILECAGLELEKEKSNSPEDLFNRSSVRFKEGKEEKRLHVVYLRIFDELMQELTPFTEHPLYKGTTRNFYFYDIVALVCLMHDGNLSRRKRLYLNSQEEFSAYFNNLDFDSLKQTMKRLDQGQSTIVNR